MNKKWEFYNSNQEKIEQISKKFNINKLIATVLVNRGITDENAIKIFLEPTRADFYNPYLLPDMDKAVDRIIRAIEEKQKIIIYGDYDVDGITSISVLKKFLEERELNVGFYIPNRLEEGYGLNKTAIKQIADDGYKLMITVDCGISGIEEIEYAKSLGIETIITDHHEPVEILPEALAVIDPKIKTSKYPFSQLAGVGVVFKFIQAISIKLNLDEREYLKYLDLVCVGTISDIVPLVDENRVIAKLGLKLVACTKNVGLKSLLYASGYKTLDANTISFGIAPRVNACGRMGYETEALELFLSNNINRVRELTNKLNEYNKNRQETEKRIFSEALEKIETDVKSNVIVVGSKNWHHGVIGIVASKITDIYYKPTILLCFDEDGMAKGSGRSLLGFDLHNALCNCNENLEKFGGHEMAVGVSLKTENFEKFKKQFEEYSKECNIEDMIPIIKIDSQVSSKDISIETVKQLDLLQPFGEANKVPVFLYKNLKIDSIRALTEGKHLKLTLKDDNNIINAIGFNLGYLVDEYLIGDKIDVVGALEVNSFNGIEKVQINIKDIMKSI